MMLSCAMTFQTYPHDTQVCAMQIESLSHTTSDLVFQWEPAVPLVVDDKIELPQLDLVSNTTGDCTQVYSTGNFTCLEVVFTFKRRLGYYLFHTYVPTCLIVIMSWISFWIKPEAVPARVTLGVTSLLTLSTQHANSQKSLPPVSYIKAIDLFMSSCTVFVFLSLMEYAMVNVILGDQIDQKPEISVMRKISRRLTIKRPRTLKRSHASQSHGDAENGVNGRPGPHILEADSGGGDSYKAESGQQLHPVTFTPNCTSPTPTNLQRSLAQEYKRVREKAILVDRFSRVFFPLSFSILNILYWCIYFEW
ncbi:unnamed protein product [Meganyctiphanes norvegica]|uniref:Uncharacterized protein n=1 Tax=Meganyctiphanes norvegica TaxID=48144 RepID=A0AAV2RG99_MEGNR